jgi:hypothetical protein
MPYKRQENEIKIECPSSYGLIELTSRRSEGNPFLTRSAQEVASTMLALLWMPVREVSGSGWV